MSISGIGATGSNYPIQPSLSPNAACACATFSRLSDIAGILASAQGSSTTQASPAAGVNSSSSNLSNATLNADLQALADMTELYGFALEQQTLTPAQVDIGKDLFGSMSEYSPAVQKLCETLKNDCTFDGNGNFTGFVGDGLYYQADWGSNWSTTQNWIGTHLNGNQNFQPTLNNPGALVNVAIILAGLEVNNGGHALAQTLDTSFFGCLTTEGPMNQILPFAIASYEYQMASADPSSSGVWSTFQARMQAISSSLEDLSLEGDGNGPYALTNLQNMVSNFQAINTGIQAGTDWSSIPSTPPSSWGSSQNDQGRWALFTELLSGPPSEFYQLVINPAYDHYFNING